jgi:hypothetical protein
MRGALASTPGGVAAVTLVSPAAAGAGEREETDSRRRVLVLALVVAVIPLLTAIAAIGTWPVGVFQDDGIYTVLAKALASGDGYRYVNIPGAPHATHYPPAYPAFLAVLWKLAPEFPANVALFTFANAVFLSLAAVGALYFGRAYVGLGSRFAAAIAVATVACVPALIFGVFVLSEPMYMALLVPTLVCAERAAGSARPRDALLAGLAGGGLAMVRTMGQFVVPALVLVLLLRRRWRAATLAAAGGVILLVPWQLWVMAHGAEVPAVLLGKYGPYSRWLTDAVRSDGPGLLVGVVGKNARALVGMAWSMFSGRNPGGPAPPAIVQGLIVCALAGLIALGAWRLRRRIPVTLWFLASYMALVIVWPFEPTRFVWVLLPIFGLMAAYGVAAVAGWRPTRWPLRLARGGVLATAVLLAAGYAVYNVRGVRERWWATIPDQNTARATPLVGWVRASTTETDVLATDDDALLHLYTGRPTVPVGTFTPQEYLQAQTYQFASVELGRIMDRYRPRYVLCSTSYGVMAARAFLVGAKPRLRVVRVLSRGVVFERIAE